jgi:hypothetical protein
VKAPDLEMEFFRINNWIFVLVYLLVYRDSWSAVKIMAMPFRTWISPARCRHY